MTAPYCFLRPTAQREGGASPGLALARLVVALCGALLAACGSDDGASSAPGQPVAADGCAYVGLNQRFDGVLSATDPQGQPLTYTIVEPPAKGAAQITDPRTGAFAYVPNTNARGTDALTFRVDNGAGSSDTAVFRFVYIPRIMPLGDSITEGRTTGDEPPLDQRISYRGRLYEQITQAGYVVDFVGQLQSGAAAGADPDHEGHPGWCDDNRPFCSISNGSTIDGSIRAFLDANRPDIVLLHIGTNHFSVDASGVNSILDKIGVWAAPEHPVTVFLARIVPSLDGSLDVTTFNNNVQAIAGARPNVNIRIVDQQRALARRDDPNRADPAYMADKLHPNADGYARMADQWWDAIAASGVLPRCD